MIFYDYYFLFSFGAKYTYLLCTPLYPYKYCPVVTDIDTLFVRDP